MFESSIKGQFLYIRHGHTDYNTQYQIYKDVKEIKYDEKFQDNGLSKTGISQCEALAEKMKDVKMKYVFISPMLRAIETAKIVLENHNNGKFKIYTHPLLTETLSACCDISKNIELKKKLIKEMSPNEDYWKYFEEFCKMNNVEEECFYMNFINSDLKYKDICKELCTNISTNRKDGMVGELIKELTDERNKPETYFGTFQRAVLFKKFLKDFTEKNKLEKDEKICIFSHSAFIRLSTSKLAYEMSDFREYPIDALKPDNCEIVSVEI